MTIAKAKRTEKRDNIPGKNFYLIYFFPNFAAKKSHKYTNNLVAGSWFLVPGSWFLILVYLQKATSNKQQATSNKQQATSNKQQATSSI